MNKIQGFKRFEKLIADFSSEFVSPLYKKMQKNSVEPINHHAGNILAQHCRYANMEKK